MLRNLSIFSNIESSYLKLEREAEHYIRVHTNIYFREQLDENRIQKNQVISVLGQFVDRVMLIPD